MNSEIKERIDQIDKGIVPEGYKKTKLGIIPRDWEVKKLGDLGDFTKGKGIPKSELRDSGIDCIIYGEIYTIYNFFTKELYSKVEVEVADESRNIKYGDLLFTSSGETLEDIGKCIMYLGNKRAVAGGDIVIMTPKDIVRNKVSSYLLNSRVINKQKYKMGQGHSVVHLYASHLKDINMPIIPLKEQEKIADILSLWDKSIETTEKLIEEKEIQKKGLMKELLTGETRLPGFSEEWEEFKVEDVTEIYLGLTYTPEYTKNGVPFLSVKDINKGKVNLSDIKYVSREEYEESTENAKPKQGDILFGRVGTLGNPIIVEKDIEFLIFVSLGYLRVNEKMLTNYYTKYWMESDLFKKQVFSIVAGSSQKNLNTGWFKKFELSLPSLSEQKAISDLLSTADKKIELLKQLLENRKEEKKGLMQLLLTGIIRV